MLEITRGYKFGRAFLYYDVYDNMEHKTAEKVSKEAVVKLCTDGKITNAKVQWWQEKPIVRLANKNLPVVNLNDTDVSSQDRPKRSTSVQPSSNGKVVDVSDKAVVVGKISNKRIKENTSFAGYDLKNVTEQRQLNSSICYDSMNSIGDLYDFIAKEFKLQDKELYKREVGKRINLNKSIASLNKSSLLSIQSSIAMYLMNMAHNEINSTFNMFNVV